MNWKTIYVLLTATLVLGAATTLSACRKETLGEKVDDAIGDATNSRPAEKLQDTGEDMKEAIKDATK